MLGAGLIGWVEEKGSRWKESGGLCKRGRREWWKGESGDLIFLRRVPGGRPGGGRGRMWSGFGGFLEWFRLGCRRRLLAHFHSCFHS